MKAKAVTGRVFGAGLVICLASASAWGQDGLRSGSLPERSLTSPAPVDQFRVGPRFYGPFADPRFPRDRPRSPRFPRRDRPFPYGSFFGPSVPYGLSDPYATEEVGYGYLQLQVVPGSAEVLVDGYYVGTVDDVRRTGGGRELEAGAHRVELRAGGFESVTFNVLIAPGEAILYRKDLEAAPRPAPPPAAPGVAKTFYVIPGCYAGDKPPGAVRLPPTCDPAKVLTIPPQVSTARVSGTTPAAGRQ